jgi:hypothetical protein
MTSPQLIAFVEAKFAEHGVTKFVPEDNVILQHARRCIQRHLMDREIAEISMDFTRRASAIELPTDLTEKIRSALAENPSLSWDDAVEQIVRGLL